MPNEKLTFEEEVIEKFISKFEDNIAGSWFVEHLPVVNLVKELLHQHKLHLLKEIEGKLPGEKEYTYDDDESYEINGFNDCLTEVKQILNNLK